MKKHTKYRDATIALLLITVIGLLVYIGLANYLTTGAQFPAQRNQWCTDKDEYYIAILDIIEMSEDEITTTKNITKVTIDTTYNITDPPVEVLGTLYLWADKWVAVADANFPIDIMGFNATAVPLTHNNYTQTDLLLNESLLNSIEAIEGDYFLLNVSLSHEERFVTVTQECHDSMPFYNATSEYLTEGYYYGIEYELEAWLSDVFDQLIYIKVQIVSECNSGIPLFQSVIFATYADGWITSAIYSLKTIATSVLLAEV